MMNVGPVIPSQSNNYYNQPKQFNGMSGQQSYAQNQSAHSNKNRQNYQLNQSSLHQSNMSGVTSAAH